jgi:aerobic-type carbon monoxide dehydrogenase small subunit (CoxS/CutS family)
MTHKLTLTVNGDRVEAVVEARLLLGDFLRQQLELRGVHLGCEHGVCGACTVLVDGEPARSCLMFAVQVDGAWVTTVESLSSAGELHPLQEAFRTSHALQCGFCTPGFLMTIDYMLREDIDLGDEVAVREALSGNLCRCTGYQNIVDAVMRVASGQPAGREEQ